jgi:elongation factor P
MIKATDLRAGQAIKWEGQLYIVKEAALQTRGNWRSFIIAKFSRVPDGAVMDQRIQSHLAIEDVNVDRKPMTFIYRDGKDYVLMDETGEQIPVGEAMIGEGVQWLIPETKVDTVMIEGKIVSIELPNTIDLQVVETPPEIKGATATNQLKEATLETGAKVRVPPFIKNGEKVRIDTRTGEYLERAK